MPTKTDRILSYLPGTFRRAPGKSALFAITDAFGGELLKGENSLAAVMQAHWVDHADRGSDVIRDLALIGALYGLSPRDDEMVEEYREHLKRYIRTFLEGTVTVQGMLRVTAEALGLHILDSYSDLNSWWTRTPPDAPLVSYTTWRDSAARLLFGVDHIHVFGTPATAAHIVGTVNLAGGFQLPPGSTLTIKIDDESPVRFDLDGVDTLDKLIETINTALGMPVASHRDEKYLLLASPLEGFSSRLVIEETADDAAPALLGLSPRRYAGRDASGAQMIGQIKHEGFIDLSQERYLRLLIDGARLAEIDCADPLVPEETTLDTICSAINTALGATIASHQDGQLQLKSETTGLGSAIVFQAPAAQDATQKLFGAVLPLYSGSDASRATVRSRDLRGGIDLRQRARLYLRIDGFSKEVDCAGGDPTQTTLDEITAAINDAFGSAVAAHNGRYLTLTSGGSGAAAEIAFEVAPEPDADASELLFDILPRQFKGSAPLPARLKSLNLSGGVNLMAQRMLHLALDGGAPLELDLYRLVTDPKNVSLETLKDVMNAAAGADIANQDGEYLSLISPVSGAGSSIALPLLEYKQQRRFVSQAVVTDEAAQEIFGFVRREASGQAATSARLEGTIDLSRGVNLTNGRYLRIVLDDQAGIDIDCAGPRPRATLLDEIVTRINQDLGSTVARHDGQYLILVSPTAGENSKIVIEPPRAADALKLLLGIEPGAVFGRNATRVQFTGIPDLRAGVDLSSANQLLLSVDGSTPVEITITGAAPTATTPAEIVQAINAAVGATIASHANGHILLTSAKIGSESQIIFDTPAANDATALIFGIAAPRSYAGADAQPARVVGNVAEGGTFDLRKARFLRLQIDNRQTIEVDCAGGSADLAVVELDNIVRAINTAARSNIASEDAGRLLISAPRPGISSRLTFEAYNGGDAFSALFGDGERTAQGSPPIPATITGTVSVNRPLNLRKRQMLRLAVNGARPVDIAVEAERLEITSAFEVVGAINALYPALASITDDGFFRLTAPTNGEASQLSLLPLRHLELIEYTPAETLAAVSGSVRHGASLTVDNRGAADAFAEVQIDAPHGVSSPSLVNLALGWRVKLLETLLPGESARLWVDDETHLKAEIRGMDGTIRTVPPEHIIVGTLAGQTMIPLVGDWPLHTSSLNPADVQLNNPLEAAIVRLSVRDTVEPGQRINISVVQNAEPGRFDVKLSLTLPDGTLIDESYPQVSIGGDARAAHALVWQINTTPSKLVRADQIEKRQMLSLPRGQSTWRYLNCYAWRYNHADYASETDQKAQEALEMASPLAAPDSPQNALKFARFSGGPCIEYGVFNASRFVNIPPLYSQKGREKFPQPEDTIAVYAPSGELPDPDVNLTIRWVHHQPGTLTVNLPADLPPRFGGRFNEARFGQTQGAPELYERVITDVLDDDKNALTALISYGDSERAVQASRFVEASVVLNVPLGWQAVKMPFRKPHFLTNGRRDEHARLYLSDEGLGERFIELKAREAGEWGNEIAVSARTSGPALYDVEIIYQGARFESARKTVLGKALDEDTLDLPAQVTDFLRPGPVGLLQAKAAGVSVKVTRDGTPDEG